MILSRAGSGISVPHEWWPSAPLLKSFEAAGFGWVQLDAPPASVLADRHHRRPARQRPSAAALATTELRPCIHAPAGLRVGARTGVARSQGFSSMPPRPAPSSSSTTRLRSPTSGRRAELRSRGRRSLRRLALRAERLGADDRDREPGAALPRGPRRSPPTRSACGALVLRGGSDAIGICLDLGHAHIVAERRHTSLRTAWSRCSTSSCLFHAHDNSARAGRQGCTRWAWTRFASTCICRPAAGTLPWARGCEARSRRTTAPVICRGCIRRFRPRPPSCGARPQRPSRRA